MTRPTEYWVLKDDSGMYHSNAGWSNNRFFSTRFETRERARNVRDATTQWDRHCVLVRVRRKAVRG